MKQQTIDLIKSMTEQGFLVIVDPEKLNDEDGVIIRVMAWKDTDNKAEATLTADDEQINAEIAELAGFKKEEPEINCKITDLASDEWAKPTQKDAIDALKKQLNDVGYELSSEPIDLLQCDGRRFRAKIVGVECEGAITIEHDKVYLCQNVRQGNDCSNKKGFECCWCVDNGSSRSLSFNDVTDFEILPEPRVIFTNCVGEAFTEEDKETNLEVWWEENNTLSSAGICHISQEDFATNEDYTDIFRSKKSLLKYLYETCE